ncbi:sensor histidine kinase [Paroceanicella profunda]|uniref:sensor histidine kinase n=1 Tax=Paroceanicella profunda TaxID=2579971 RepID=UPI001478D275|nr:HAMP domain-containing sensor histidine kinase [Paroceanicella profunda]
MLVDTLDGPGEEMHPGIALMPAELRMAGDTATAQQMAAGSRPDCLLLPPGGGDRGVAEHLRRAFPDTPMFRLHPWTPEAGEPPEAAAIARAISAERAACRKELEEFIQIAVHDLRAPLRACLTIPSWIRDDLEAAKQDYAPIAEDVEMLLTQANRMSALLEALSTYARVGHGDRPDDTVEPAGLIARVAARPGMPADLHVRVASGLPALTLRRSDMETLLEQLLLNAARHSARPAPRVDLEVATPPGGGLRISVTDDGQGIPEQYRERVFRPGTALRPRDEVEGSGMGLAIVRRIARHWGGEAGIEDAPGGKGVRIAIRLPANSPVLGSIERG